MITIEIFFWEMIALVVLVTILRVFLKEKPEPKQESQQVPQPKEHDTSDYISQPEIFSPLQMGITGHPINLDGNPFTPF